MSDLPRSPQPAPAPPSRRSPREAIAARFRALHKAVVVELWVNTVLSSRFVPWRPRLLFLRLWGMDIGAGSVIHPGCRFGSANLSVGRNCKLVGMEYDGDAPVTIGDETVIGVEVRFTTRTHAVGGGARRRSYIDVDKPIAVGSGVWIPQRAIVMPGINIADGCVIAPGAVVTADTEPDGLYGGVPAKRLRDLEV